MSDSIWFTVVTLCLLASVTNQREEGRARDSRRETSPSSLFLKAPFVPNSHVTLIIIIKYTSIRKSNLNQSHKTHVTVLISFWNISRRNPHTPA